MAPAFGLYGHIRRNRARSRLLIAGLFALVYVLCFALILIAGDERTVAHPFEAMVILGPIATIATGIWVWVGFKWNVGLIARLTGASNVEAAGQPRLRRAIETLCISRGMKTPRIAVIDSPALNAFASGVNEDQHTVTVTTGLLQALDDRELEAVLAHELTHIRNGDVRLMIVAVLIAGVVSMIGELAFRGILYGGGRPSDDSRRKGGGATIFIGFALIAVAWISALLIRFSLSRSREYLADAGAVELTKDPDALISALLKIEGRADIPKVSSGIMDMCFENDPDAGGDLFSTHPTVAARVRALIETAGGRIPEARSNSLAAGANEAASGMARAASS